MLKKTIIAAALVSSSLVASSAFAGGLQSLVNKDNTSTYYLAIANTAGLCSTMLGDNGIATPGGPAISSTAAQINLVCGGKYPCTTNTFAFTSKPPTGLFCKGGTLIATSKLENLTTGQVTFTYLNGSFPATFKGKTSGTAVVNQPITPDANGVLEIDTTGK